MLLWTFDRTQRKEWLGLAEMGHQELVSVTTTHHSLITYGGHGMVQQQKMRWHSCTANHVSFGPDLVECFKTFDRAQPEQWLGLAKTDYQELISQQNNPSLMGHIWRTWNGPAAIDEVTCLQTMWVLAKKVTWLRLAKMDHQELVSQ
jgi:hypothetical protein